MLYYEPFVAFVPEGHKLSEKKKISSDDLELDDLLLLEDGHCFKDSVVHLCKSKQGQLENHFQLQSGSFETLIKLSNEGLGMTLLPYLHTLDLPDKQIKKLRYFTDPPPAREVSLIYNKSELKMQIIDALYDVIAGVIRGAIRFNEVKIISPLK